MKKILLGESILLAVLVIAAIFVRVGILDEADAATEPSRTATDVLSSQPLDTQPGPTETQTTQTNSSEPEMLTQLDGVTNRSFAYDCTTGTLLYSNADMTDRIYPASLTKLMTALVVLEYMDPKTWVTAGDELDMVAWDASVAGLTKGDCLTVKQLIGGMLLPSGNDAAYVLAAATGRVLTNMDPAISEPQALVSVFMDEVNAYGQRIGLTGTHFTVPDGYHDDNHYTTPADMLIIAQRCLENPLIMEFTGKSSETVVLQDGVEREWHNSNLLVDPQSNFFSQQAIGLKTGYTSIAGRCLIAAFRNSERMVIVGVFGASEREASFRQALAVWFGVK